MIEAEKRKERNKKSYLVIGRIKKIEQRKIEKDIRKNKDRRGNILEIGSSKDIKNIKKIVKERIGQR